MCCSTDLPVKQLIEESERIKAHIYLFLLTTEYGQMPDHNNPKNWNEQEGKARWPKVYDDDIDRCFTRYTKPSPHRKDL